MQPISIPQIQYYWTNLQQLILQKGKIQQEKFAQFSQNICHLSQEYLNSNFGFFTSMWFRLFSKCLLIILQNNASCKVISIYNEFQNVQLECELRKQMFFNEVYMLLSLLLGITQHTTITLKKIWPEDRSSLTLLPRTLATRSRHHT